MAALQLTLDLRCDEVPSLRVRSRTGAKVPCDHCGRLHWRKKRRLNRNNTPARLHPSSGGWFCSRQCRGKAERSKRIRLTCLHCGTPVERTTSQVRKRTFCSRSCKDTYGLSEVRCCWPGCVIMLPCRITDGVDRHGQPLREHKTVLLKRGVYVKHPMCSKHRRIAFEYLGRNSRVTTGRTRLGYGEEYDTRGASSLFLRMVLFERAGKRCEECSIALEFTAPKSWQTDHIVPVFKGGRTTLTNLRTLCKKCHDVKTAAEKSEAALERHQNTKLHRWMTHYQKDRLIERLRARLSELGAPTD
jgi:hypothetical protein